MSIKFSGAKSIITRAASRGTLKLGKHSPVIMFSVGIVGVVATAVLASKATLNLDEIIQETEDQRSSAKAFLERDNDYDDDKYHADMRTLQIRQSLKVLRLYAPAIGVGVLSIACLTGSHVVLTKRNTALMAAYATLDRGFKSYRARVEDEYGPDKDREFYHGVETEEVEVVTKKGELKKQTVETAAGPSMYGRLYNKHNPLFVHSSPELNIAQLRMYQNTLNWKLKSQGHLFLNEAYDQLNYPRTKAGQVVGWIYEGGSGDGHVDFGIWDDENMENLVNFMSRREEELVLDFNVDGVIYDKI